MILSKKLLKYKYIRHCFLGREGGKSKGIYKSLNCVRGSCDTKINVKKNLKIACGKIGWTNKNLILLHQVHSNKFFFINKRKYKTKLVGDALITNRKNVVLGILTADCAPIIIYDPKLKIISAIHAGWKGAYKEIIKKVVNFLIKSGSDTKDLVAAIGPCIAQKNYEIKSDFKLKFLKQNIVNKTFFKKNYNQLAIVGNLSHKNEHKSVAHQLFLSGGPLAILPLQGKRSTFVWSLPIEIGNKISKSTDILVSGENSGSKLKKAKELGITVMNEKEWNNLAG